MIFTDDLGLDENDENDEEKASRSENEETAHWFAPPSSQLDCLVVQVGLQFPTKKDFSKLLHGFVKIYTWISQSCYMDLSKFLYGFLKVVTWIY